MDKSGFFRERSWNLLDAVIFLGITKVAEAIWERVDSQRGEIAFVVAVLLVGFFGSWLIRRYIARRVRGLTGTELGQRRAELDKKEKHLNEFHDQMEMVVRERKQFFDLHESLYQTTHFGRELKKFPPLDEMTLQVMSGSVSELLPSLTDTMAEATTAWNSMLTAAAAQFNKGENLAVVALADRVGKCEVQRAYSVVERLKDALFRKRDPRPWLVLVYACYREYRSWTTQLTYMTGGPAPELAGFTNWREADLRFADELTRKLAHPALTLVANEINLEDQRQGGPLRRTPPIFIPPSTSDPNTEVQRPRESDS
jgi:hypothetical protein